jgi:predicted RNA-binding Zn-ribbon protein involved in translation (DUF1610 family)
MQAKIICTAVKADGSTCGAEAVVGKARYEFDPLLEPSPCGVKHTLREAHYDIECPHCGSRTQSEKQSQPQG